MTFDTLQESTQIEEYNTYSKQLIIELVSQFHSELVYKMEKEVV